MNKIRLTLASPVCPRDSIQSKDAIAINVFIDHDPTGVVYATKRAGYTLKTSSVTATVSKGIIYSTNQNLLYYINDKKVPVNIP